MHHVYAVLASQPDQALEERQVNTLRRRVAGKIDDQHLGLGKRILERALEFLEKIDLGRVAHMVNVGAGNHRPVDMNRVTRVGHQHDIASLERRQRQMRDAFLRADGDNGLAFRIEIDSVAPLVPAADGLAQTQDAFRHRIAMGVGSSRGLDQLVDDMLRRRPVRIAHRQIDDILAAAPGRHFQLPGNVEHIWGQPFDTWELFHFMRRSITTDGA